MFHKHVQILDVFLKTDIKDVCTYGGYKGDYILKLTTKHTALATAIMDFCENLEVECVLKENKNMLVYELYCIVEDQDVYKLKRK